MYLVSKVDLFEYIKRLQCSALQWSFLEVLLCLQRENRGRKEGGETTAKRRKRGQRVRWFQIG